MEECYYCKNLFSFELKRDTDGRKICGDCQRNKLTKARTKSGLPKRARRASEPLPLKAKPRSSRAGSGISPSTRPMARPPNGLSPQSPGSKRIPRGEKQTKKIIFKSRPPRGDLDALIEHMKKDYQDYNLNFIKPTQEMMKCLQKAWVREEGAKDMWIRNFERNMKMFLVFEEYADQITEFMKGVNPETRRETFQNMEVKLQTIHPPDEEGQQVAVNTERLADDLDQLHEHFMGLRDLVMRWYEVPKQDKVNFILEVIAHEKGYQISLNALERYRPPSEDLEGYIQIHLDKQTYYDIWTGWKLQFPISIVNLIKKGWQIAIKDTDGTEKRNSDPGYPQYRNMWVGLLTWLDQAMMHWRPKPLDINEDIDQFTKQLKKQRNTLKQALVYTSKCMAPKDVDRLLDEEIYNVLLSNWASDKWEISDDRRIKRGKLLAREGRNEICLGYLEKLQGFIVEREKKEEKIMKEPQAPKPEVKESGGRVSYARGVCQGVFSNWTFKETGIVMALMLNDEAAKGKTLEQLADRSFTRKQDGRIFKVEDIDLKNKKVIFIRS